MKFLVFISLFFLSACSTPEPGSAAAHLKYVEREVDEIMEMVDLPDWGLHKMAKKDDFTNPDFLMAIKQVHKEMSRMATLNHPEPKFNEFSKECIEALEGFIEGAGSNKVVLKKNWLKVKNSCVACHDIYE